MPSYLELCPIHFFLLPYPSSPWNAEQRLEPQTFCNIIEPGKIGFLSRMAKMGQGGGLGAQRILGTASCCLILPVPSLLNSNFHTQYTILLTKISSNNVPWSTLRYSASHEQMSSVLFSLFSSSSGGGGSSLW